MNATILVAAAAFLLLAYFVSGFVFYRIAIARTPKKFLDTDPSLPENVDGITEEVSAWWEAQEKREIRVRSFDGLELAADYLPAPEPTDVAAILIHGYTGTGPTMKRYARLFRERFGCDVLTPDLRGHGRSGGGYIGMGLHDARDIHSWMERLAPLRGKDVRVVLFGVSMGASTALLAAEAAPGPRIACVVSDCAYSDAGRILAYKLKKLYGLPSFPLLGAASNVCRILAGYDPRSVSPLAAVARASAPFLFIHGDADTFVPAEMAEELFAAAAPERKELFIVPGAAHADSYRTAGSAYADRVAAFVGAALS
jgi:fermentation-respiration switch protein FrsA (DUF1100 family)